MLQLISKLCLWLISFCSAWNKNLSFLFIHLQYTVYVHKAIINCDMLGLYTVCQKACITGNINRFSTFFHSWTHQFRRNTCYFSQSGLSLSLLLQYVKLKYWNFMMHKNYAQQIVMCESPTPKKYSENDVDFISFTDENSR